MSHIPNTKQEQAFKDVVSAIKKATKTGLVFYGKQENLVAYTKDADSYANKHEFRQLFGNGLGHIPSLVHPILRDSGADDYPQYFNAEDEQKYNPKGY